MNNWLLFLVKSTLILSLLYLLFRLVMRKEAFFRLNRMILLFIVLISVIIPFISLPHEIHPIASVKLDPIFNSNLIIEEPVQVNEASEEIYSFVEGSEKLQPFVFSINTIVMFVYLAGGFIFFLIFISSIISVLRLFRKSKKTDLNGIHLMIVDSDIPTFSFRHSVLISQYDYDTNFEEIITHELSHIRKGHFYDLMLIEIVKIIYWFNPLVYQMVRDLKEIHEFEADECTLNSGIDPTKYQMLIIQKCVGHQMFALANSFDHCQIKKRIAMINKSKINKAWCWKVATFLPLLALLLMAFGKRGENVPGKRNLAETVISPILSDSFTFKSLSSSDLKNEYQKNTDDIITVFINKNSQLMINAKKVNFQDVPGIVSSSYESTLKEKLGEPTPGVFNKTLPDIKVIVQKDVTTYKEDYKILLNQVSSGICMVQEKYSNKIFGESYKSLSQTNREKIRMLIEPLIYFAPDKKMSSVMRTSTVALPNTVQKQYVQFKRKIEIRKDGNYIDGKLCSIEEIANIGKEWYKASNDWILLLVDESIPLSRIDEVRGTLKTYFVVQQTVNSEDLVYFAGDVSKLAKFKQGEFDVWVSRQFKNYPEAISEVESEVPVTTETILAHPELKVRVRKFSITFDFIIGKDGKVRDAHIVKGSGLPALDAAYEKILSQIPDWEPAKRGGLNVSVYNHVMAGGVYYASPATPKHE